MPSKLKTTRNTPLVKQVVYITHCKEEECTPWGNCETFPGEGVRKELTKGLGLTLGDPGEAFKKQSSVLDWTLSGSGTILWLAILINLLYGEGRLELA